MAEEFAPPRRPELRSTARPPGRHSPFVGTWGLNGWEFVSLGPKSGLFTGPSLRVDGVQHIGVCGGRCAKGSPSVDAKNPLSEDAAQAINQF